MNIYRSAPPVDDDIVIKPRSKWPFFVALTVMWSFLAFVYYAFFSAFGRDAFVVIPMPLALTLGMTYRICRTYKDQNKQ